MAFVFLALAVLIIVVWLSLLISVRNEQVRRAHRLAALTVVMVIGIGFALATPRDSLLVSLVFLYAIGYGVAAWTIVRAFTANAEMSASPEFGNELYLVDAANHDAPRHFPTVM